MEYQANLSSKSYVNQKALKLQQEKERERQKQLKEDRNYKTTTWGRNHKFIDIDVNSLQSKLLEDNDNFNYTLDVLREFNKDLVTHGERQQEMKNGPWKLEFCNHLFGMLSEVVFTKDRILQQSFAEKAKNWAVDQLIQLNSNGGAGPLELEQLEILQSTNKISFKDIPPKSISEQAEQGRQRIKKIRKIKIKTNECSLKIKSQKYQYVW